MKNNCKLDILIKIAIFKMKQKYSDVPVTQCENSGDLRLNMIIFYWERVIPQHLPW